MKSIDFDKRLIGLRSETANSQAFKSMVQKALSIFQLKVSEMPDPSKVMITVAQKINLYHLLQRVINYDVEGEVVELGCFEGQTALFIKKLLLRAESQKRLLLFDNFRHPIGLKGDIRQKLINNFQQNQLPEPELIEGDFEDTLPGKLPKKIAFVHIDCGYGGAQQEHQKVVMHSLQSVYPLMSTGAVGVLMDYHDQERTVEGLDANPGVKAACDIYFRDKKESIFTLYGGEFSHAAFIKL